MPFPPDLPPELRLKAARLLIDARLIEENFIRGTGKGGQNRNKRSTAVQLIYPPMDIEIRCQEERDQHQNRLRAYQRLIEKVEEWENEAIHDIEEHEYLEHRGEGIARRAKDKTIRKKKERGEIKRMRQKPGNY